MSLGYLVGLGIVFAFFFAASKMNEPHEKGELEFLKKLRKESKDAD